MDRRAVQTLLNAYWSPAGWREPPAKPPEDELAHAIDVGVMFEGTYDATHDEVVDAVIAARDSVEEAEVLAAFLSSLTSHPEPTSDDRTLLEALLDELEAAPPSTTAPTAAAGLLRDLRGNKAERAVLIDILGVCSVLETSEHRGYGERFVRYADREIPGKRFVEHFYPACWWTAADGVNREPLMR